MADTFDEAQARALLERVRAADGRAPDGPPDADAAAVHVRHDADGTLIALAWRQHAGEAAELYVDPAHRGRGIGRELAAALLADDDGGAGVTVTDDEHSVPSARPGIWAHGTLPAARGLAARLSLVAERELLQLRAPLAPFLLAGDPAASSNTSPADDLADGPAAPASASPGAGTIDDALPRGDRPIDDALPRGVVIRTFEPGADDAEFLRVNAAAFAWHPEQGGLSQADLDAEMAEPWFDADGFFLAVPADDPARVLGFHWTKVHPAKPPAEPEALGEIYVLAVDPATRVRRLGGPLTAAGLRYLASLGLGTALLYVEADNERAVRLYRRYGFTDHAVDTVFG